MYRYYTMNEGDLNERLIIYTNQGASEHNLKNIDIDIPKTSWWF